MAANLKKNEGLSVHQSLDWEHVSLNLKTADQPGTTGHAQQILTTLKSCDDEFKNGTSKSLTLLIKKTASHLIMSKPCLITLMMRCLT